MGLGSDFSMGGGGEWGSRGGREVGDGICVWFFFMYLTLYCVFGVGRGLYVLCSFYCSEHTSDSRIYSQFLLSSSTVHQPNPTNPTIPLPTSPHTHHYSLSTLRTFGTNPSSCFRSFSDGVSPNTRSAVSLT